MLKLLERSVVNIERQLVLIAPAHAAVPAVFKNVTVDPARHQQLVHEMQVLRGSVYLQEGNLAPTQLSPDGRHQTPEDARSWHLLMTDRQGRVSSCIWYLHHDEAPSFYSLRTRSCPLAKLDAWCDKLRSAVESDLSRARSENLRYAEVGGWAVAKARRCTSEGLMLALAAYGLGRMLGGALGITTANVAHASSSILRRLGGAYLEHDGTEIPAYYDASYNAHIELLRFDSRRPSAKYAGIINLLCQKLETVVVVAANRGTTVCEQPEADSELLVPQFAV